MAKRTLTPAQINNLLRFKPGWIKDPVPMFRRFLDRATLKRLVRAKSDFRKQVESIVKKRRG